MAADPYETAVSALELVWQRGNPATYKDRYARAIVDALTDSKFLTSGSQKTLVGRGRPRVIPPLLRERIRRMHRSGESFNAIARRLNLEGVPAATGIWHHSSVARIVREPVRAPEVASEG